MNDNVIDTNDILKMINRSSSQLTKIKATGKFPTSFKLFEGRKNYWSKQEIEMWVNDNFKKEITK